MVAQRFQRRHDSQVITCSDSLNFVQWGTEQCEDNLRVNAVNGDKVIGISAYVHML